MAKSLVYIEKTFNALGSLSVGLKVRQVVEKHHSETLIFKHI